MLRSNMPKAEIVLWSKLKNKAVDGYSHFSEVSEVFDKERQDFIESFGILFLRFTNKEIYRNLDQVLAKIEDCIQERSIGKGGMD